MERSDSLMEFILVVEIFFPADKRCMDRIDVKITGNQSRQEFLHTT
jgi:hypothetical protein